MWQRLLLRVCRSVRLHFRKTRDQLLHSSSVRRGRARADVPAEAVRIVPHSREEGTAHRNRGEGIVHPSRAVSRIVPHSRTALAQDREVGTVRVVAGLPRVRRRGPIPEGPVAVRPPDLGRTTSSVRRIVRG